MLNLKNGTYHGFHVKREGRCLADPSVLSKIQCILHKDIGIKCPHSVIKLMANEFAKDTQLSK